MNNTVENDLFHMVKWLHLTGEVDKLDVHIKFSQDLTYKKSLKNLKSVNIWQTYKQKRDCLMHFLCLLAVRWPGTQSA